MKVWTEAKALRSTNAKLRRAAKLLGEVAYLWGDVDNYAVGLCDDLIQRTETLRLDIVAASQARVEEAA